MTGVQRPSRCEGLEVNQVADGLVVYQAAPEQVHYLNNTSAVIFELCEGHRSIEEIAEQVQDVFSLPAPPVDEVKACVSDLVDKAVVR
jgi:Coenzyme PQQ synthesis protein D (PqqD)